MPEVVEPESGSSLRHRLRVALRDAMKARDKPAVDALRSALSALDNAEAVPSTPTPTKTAGPIAGAVHGAGAGDVARRELTEDETKAIVTTEIQERRSAAADYDRLGQADQAAVLRTQADLLEAQLYGPGEAEAD